MKKILIIEDDLIVSSVYKNLLETRGYSVQVAVDGQAGYYQMTEFQPHAVLLDIMLPKMNGVEILRKIRAQKQFQQIPVLVFTNAFVPNMVDIAKQSGANFIFSKSTLTSRQLLEALTQCIEFAGTNFGTTHIPKSTAVAPSPTEDSDTSMFGNAPYRTAVQPPPLPIIVTSPSPTFFAPEVATPPANPTPVPNPYAPSSAPSTPAAPTAAPAPSNPPIQIAAWARAPLRETNEADARMQLELKNDFVQTIDGTVTKLRSNLAELAKANDESGRSKVLEELHRQVRSLGGNAGLAGFRPVADLCAAFEVLLAELAEKPRNLNPSIQRTVANTADCLTELMIRRIEDNLLENPTPAILVVDDEVLSRRAVTFALEKGHLRPTAIENPTEALSLATTQRYDLIFLDVQMPGLDGFELCSQIRAQAVNQNTPVIFVTSMSDFKSRARSTLAGATDLIAKPFMFIELTVKAVSTLLQNRALSQHQQRGKAA